MNTELKANSRKDRGIDLEGCLVQVKASKRRDASPGLGEAVVSGIVNPDHFVVEPGSGEIRERRLGDKRFSVRSIEGGGTRQVESAPADGEACLTDPRLRNAARATM